MTDNDIMLEAFKAAYHDRDYYPDTKEADEWWCEKLGTWKRAWDAATATAYEACAVTCERVKSDGMAGPQFWLDWDVLDDAIAAIRARGGDDGQEEA